MKNLFLSICLSICLLSIMSCGNNDNNGVVRTSELGVSSGECKQELQDMAQNIVDNCYDIEDVQLEDRPQVLRCENDLKKFSQNYSNVGCKMELEFEGQKFDAEFLKNSDSQLAKIQRKVDTLLNNSKDEENCGLNVAHSLTQNIFLQSEREGLDSDEIKDLFKKEKAVVLENIEVFKKQYPQINCTIRITEYDDLLFITDEYTQLITEEVLNDISSQVSKL